MRTKLALLYLFNMAAAAALAGQLANPALRFTAETPLEFAEQYGFSISSQDRNVFDRLSDTRVIELGSANERMAQCGMSLTECMDSEGYSAGFVENTSVLKKIGRPDIITIMAAGETADSWSLGAAEKIIRRPIDDRSIREFVFRHELSHAFHTLTRDKNYLSLTKPNGELRADIDALQGMPEEKQASVGRMVFALRAVNVLDDTHDTSLELEDRLTGRKRKYNPAAKEKSAQLVRIWALECMEAAERRKILLPIGDMVQQCESPLPRTDDAETETLVYRRIGNFLNAYDYLYRPQTLS